MRSVNDIRKENLIVLRNRFKTLADLNLAIDKRKTDSTLSQIINGAKDTRSGNIKNLGDRLARDIENKLSLGYGWMDQDHSGDPPEDKNLITLNRLNIEAGCNPAGGSSGENVAIVERIQVNPEWFKQNIARYRTTGYELVTARGDSMEPTISSGDIVVVDVKDTDITQEGIFCFNYGSGVTIKRLQVIPFGLEFISDNKLYNSFVLKGQEIESVKIIGRVITALCIKKFPHGI